MPIERWRKGATVSTAAQDSCLEVLGWSATPSFSFVPGLVPGSCGTVKLKKGGKVVYISSGSPLPFRSNIPRWKKVEANVDVQMYRGGCRI
jgi:hypothetical protein